MQISPRYDGSAVLELDVPIGDVAVPLLRQRRRLGDALASFDDEQWSAESRCDGWSAQDVVAHLVGTNQYWAISISAGLKGEPTRYLAAFDPVATPAQMVDGMRAMSPADVLAQYRDSVEQLAGVVTALDGAAWATVAETPIGHVSARCVALHALWDAWTHERDILLPLGRTQPIESDEVTGCLLYAAAIGPSLRASHGATRLGTLAVDATNPDASFVVQAGPSVKVTQEPAPAGAPRLTGDAVALVEGLTFRAPLEHGLADEHVWLLSGLDEAFDHVPRAATA